MLYNCLFIVHSQLPKITRRWPRFFSIWFWLTANPSIYDIKWFVDNNIKTCEKRLMLFAHCSFLPLISPCILFRQIQENVNANDCHRSNRSPPWTHTQSFFLLQLSKYLPSATTKIKSHWTWMNTCLSVLKINCTSPITWSVCGEHMYRYRETL